MLRKLTFYAAVPFLALAILVGSADKAMARDKDPNVISSATWTYFNFVTVFSPNWSFIIMPGHRYEFNQDKPGVVNQPPGETFLLELFAGPVYTHKVDDSLTLKCGLWYYYMSFPNYSTSPETQISDRYSHNFEIVPIVDYKIAGLTLSNRIILHNKFYAKNADFTTSKERWGFSTTLREMIGVTVPLTEMVSATLSNEWFFGIIEDSDTKDMMNGARHLQGEPYFEVGGFNTNRLYTGFTFKLTPQVSLATQYVWETSFDPNNDYELTRHRHYIFLTLTYVLKMF